MEHDDGGEFVSNKADALYAQLGVIVTSKKTPRVETPGV